MTRMSASPPRPTTATLSYRLSPDGAGALRLSWVLENPPPGFGGFVLLAAQTRVPGSIHDDLELYRCSGATAGTHDARIDLHAIRDEDWDFFCCKLVLLNGSDLATTLVIHPDTNVRFRSDGQVIRQDPTRPPQKYARGTPRTLICPTCFDVFPTDRLLFAFGPDGAPIRARYSWLRRLRGINRIVPPKDPQGRRATYRFCPQGHLLPFSAGSQCSLTLGMIGARYSGKTTYVCSLVHSLEMDVGTDNNLTILPANTQTGQRFKDEFEKVLFEQQNQLPASVGEPPPLIYDLVFSMRDDEDQRRVTCSFYDTAGENLQDPIHAEQMARYVRVAAGLLLLIDPLQIRAVRDKLPPEALQSSLDPDATPAGILGNILGPLQRHKVVATDGPLPIPIAVVMTKCDVLRNHARELGIEPNRLWGREDKRHIGRFNRLWHEDMSGMMGECLRRWDPAAYGLIVNRFPNHAFFGASATGCTPDVRGRYRVVSPFRVEDPLLWLLTQLGVFPE